VSKKPAGKSTAVWAARQNEKFSAIDEAVGEDGWKIVGLLRLSPPAASFTFTWVTSAKPTLAERNEQQTALHSCC